MGVIFGTFEFLLAQRGSICFYFTMSYLNDLRVAIEELRTPNCEGDKYFIPQEPLHSLMTPGLLKNVLPECRIALQHMPEAVTEVLSSLRKIFALLVISGEAEMIINFMTQDQLQVSPMDQKLPFSLEQFAKIFPSKTANYKIRSLFDKQWEFITPVFSGKVVARALADKIILPIVEEKEIGDGGFGTIYEIKVYEGYCSFDGTQPDAVRSYGRQFCVGVC